MIQVNAAARLKVMAGVREDQAKEYLNSLGLHVGKHEETTHLSVSFATDDKAEAVLTKKFGHGKPNMPKTGLIFTINAERYIVLLRSHGQWPAMLSLVDRDD